MIVSYNWLREFVEFDLDVHGVAELLTNQGIEVAQIEYLGDSFSEIVVAEILEIEKHPDADKLSLCKVSDGENEHKVICGAGNIFVGAKVPLARIGAVLPGDFVIKKAKIRGVESFGMLCSEKELGLANESSGIWILDEDSKIGEPIAKILEMDDYILELEITPNRGDCLSILGIAREIGAGLGVEVKMPELKDWMPSKASKDFNVLVEDPLGCLKYSADLITDVSPGDTPLWMKNRLRKAGFRPISPIVDITNYVLIELGHPMHAFDYDKIKGDNIVVRGAHGGEKMVTLDKETKDLAESDLVIADSEGPVALAGVIGGLESGVSEDTKTIVFESAYFEARTVRKSAKRLVISTDSSYRFERGVCPRMMNYALSRANNLLMQISPGAKFLKRVEVSNKDFEDKIIILRKERVNRVIGKEYQDSAITKFLLRIGFEIEGVQDGIYKVRVPLYRNDITDEIDLIEEVIRIDGYSNIPKTPLLVTPSLDNSSKSREFIDDVKVFCSGLGFCEARNYSFTSGKNIELFNGTGEEVFEILNPLSDEERFMVASRLPRLIANGINSFKRNVSSIKLFEIGKSFTKRSFDAEKLSENEVNNIAGVLIGDQGEIYWKEKIPGIDFDYLKGFVDAFLGWLNISEYHFTGAGLKFLDPVASAKILLKNGDELGSIGKVSEDIKKAFDIKTDIYVFEFNLDLLREVSDTNKVFTKLSVFPPIERDLSLIVKKDLVFGDISKIIFNTGGSLLKDIKVFDIYEGDQIKEGHKNIALRLYFQSHKETLSDDKVNNIQDKILKVLDKEYGVKLRE